jgi:hypothetical protein
MEDLIGTLLILLALAAPPLFLIALAWEFENTGRVIKAEKQEFFNECLQSEPKYKCTAMWEGNPQ